MSSQDAFKIVQDCQRNKIYVVADEHAKTMLTTALKQLFEENADIYIARIRVDGEPTPIG